MVVVSSCWVLFVHMQHVCGWNVRWVWLLYCWNSVMTNYHHVGCKRMMLMKRMTFASSVPSHVYAGLHQLERKCRLCLVGAQQQCVRSVVNDVSVECWHKSRQCLATVLPSLVGTKTKMVNMWFVGDNDMLRWLDDAYHEDHSCSMKEWIRCAACCENDSRSMSTRTRSL